MDRKKSSIKKKPPSYTGRQRVKKQEAQKAEVAVLERCIGKLGGAVMTRQRRAIREYEKAEKEKAKKGGILYYDIERCMEGSEKKILPDGAKEEEQRRLNRISRQQDIIAKAYLGQTFHQRAWLQKIADGEKKTELGDFATKACGIINEYYLKLREDKPLHYLQHKYRRCNTVRQKHHAELRKKTREIAISEVGRMFRNLETFRKMKQAKKCVDEAHKIKLLLEKNSVRTMPEKGQLGEKLARLMGDIYFERKACNPKFSEEENRLRIVCAFGFDEMYNRMGVDATVQKDDFPFYNNKAWRKDYQKFVSVAESDIEKAWLRHELGRTYLHDRKWEHLVAEGHKCRDSGKKCDSIPWQINGLFLVAMGASKRRDHEEAMEAIEEAVRIADRAGMYRALEGLEIAKSELAKVQQQQGTKLTDDVLKRKREEEIIKYMTNDPEKQAKVKEIFKKMRAPQRKHRGTLFSKMDFWDLVSTTAPLRKL